MTAKLSFLSIAALAAVPSLFACGGDDGPTHVTTHDAAPSVDAPPPCLAAASYTPASLADQGGTDYPEDTAEMLPHEVFFGGSLNAVPDDLILDLYAGYGVFDAGDIRTGDFTISGDETSFDTCGLCVMIAAADSADAVGQWYVAQSGVVKLTSVAGRLTGMLTNVMLASADTDSETGLPGAVNGTCTSTIVSASFDGALMAPSAVGKPARVRLHSPRARHSR